MAIKVIKGQICDGTISKNKYHQEYYLHGKFHVFTKKCTILPILGAVPLYYIGINYLDRNKEKYNKRVGFAIPNPKNNAECLEQLV